MEKRTLDQLIGAFKAVENDLSERAEYEQIVRLNDLLSMLKLQTEEYWAPRIAS